MRARPLAVAAVATAVMAAVATLAAPMPTAPQLIWAFNVTADASEQYTFGYPAYSEGRAFLAGTCASATTLWALDAFTGRQLWTWNTTETGGMYTEAGAGVVFVGTGSGVTALNATTGAVKWFYDQSHLPHIAKAPGGHWPGKPSFRYSEQSVALVYVTWYDTPMVALYVENGLEFFRTQGAVAGRIWQTRRGMYFYQFKPTNDTATDVPSYYLTRYDGMELTPMWQVGPVSSGYTTAAATADALASKVKYSDTAAALLIFNVTNGATLRTVPANAHFDYGVAQGHIFQMLPQPEEPHVAVVCYSGLTGDTVWRSTVPTSYRGSNVVASDNYVLLQGAAETWVLSAVDGTVLYSIPTAAPSYGSVVDGDTYIMGFGGNAVGAFRLSVGGPM